MSKDKTVTLLRHKAETWQTCSSWNITGKGKNPEKDGTTRCPLSKCSSKEVLEVVGRHYNTSGYTYAQTSLSESVLECIDDSVAQGTYHQPIKPLKTLSLELSPSSCTVDMTRETITSAEIHQTTPSRVNNSFF